MAIFAAECRVISEAHPVTLSDRGCYQHLAQETLGLEG